MKKYFLFVVVLFSLVSCEEDVHFNTSSFQGTKDNVFWRAVQSKATVASDGSLVIEAYTGNEITTLKINETALTSYFLGVDAANMATYVLNDASGKVTFATGTDVGNGEIVLTEYDAVNHTVSGTFKFNAVNINNNPLFGEEVNFQYGVFYKVPVVSAL